jgi:hypothetical protein
MYAGFVADSGGRLVPADLTRSLPLHDVLAVVRRREANRRPAEPVGRCYNASLLIKRA